MKKFIVGVMGPGSEATKQDMKNAYEIGKLIAENGWILLSGGMNKGAMKAVNEGAKKGGGLTVGILPNDDTSTHSPHVDIPIITNMRSGRNYINALSSNALIACGMNPGTSCEISYAIQLEKPIVLLGSDDISRNFFKKLGKNLIHVATTPQEAITVIKGFMPKSKK